MQIVGLALVVTAVLAGAIVTAGGMIESAIRALARSIAEEAYQNRKQLGEHQRLEQLRTPSRLPPPPRVPVFGEGQLDAHEKAYASERVMTALGMQNTRPPRGS
jgi:hypothetical protein